MKRREQKTVFARQSLGQLRQKRIEQKSVQETEVTRQSLGQLRQKRKEQKSVQETELTRQSLGQLSVQETVPTRHVGDARARRYWRVGFM